MGQFTITTIESNTFVLVSAHHVSNRDLLRKVVTSDTQSHA
mgnify:CR=1 FL=1